MTTATAIRIERAEIVTGDREGTNVLSIWSDANGTPGQELTTTAWEMQWTVGWQGVDFDAPALVDSGAHFWVVWKPVPNSVASTCYDGQSTIDLLTTDGGKNWSPSGDYNGMTRVLCCK